MNHFSKHSAFPKSCGNSSSFPKAEIDLLAILRKSLDRALLLYNFIREIRSSGVRGSITIMHIRKFFKLHHNIVRFRVFPRIAKRSIDHVPTTEKDPLSKYEVHKQ